MQALAILSILLTWSFYALVCVGLGAWLPRTKSANPDPADNFFAGLATLLALLQLWHFLAPINLLPHITLILLGILLSTTLLRKSTLRSLLKTPRWAAILFTLVAIWLANRATGPNAEYDTGLYHLQAIQWTQTFRIVPGLANLHMPSASPAPSPSSPPSSTRASGKATPATSKTASSSSPSPP